MTVLLVSRDGYARAQVARLAAVAGMAVDAPEEPSARSAAWRTAAAVVVDASATDLLPDLAPPRRDGVFVLAGDTSSVGAWRCAAFVGAAEVFGLPADERRFVEHLVTAVDGGTAPGHVVGVCAAASAAGASTFAAALAARGAARGRTVALVDADVAGGGLDVLLGAEHVPGLRWSSLDRLRGAVTSEALTEALIDVAGVRLLSCDRTPHVAIAPEAMRTVLAAAGRGHDLVIVDLPRRLDDAGSVAAQACELLTAVVPADVRGTAVAAGSIAALRSHRADLHLVVRESAPRRLGAREVARALDLPLAGIVPTEPAVATATDRGQLLTAVGRSRLAAVADAVLDAADRRRNAA